MIETISKYSEIIREFSIDLFEEEGFSYRLNSHLIFIDDSILVVKDYVFQNNERKYSYHWMDMNHKMILRWDNCEHWKNIETFPHHCHNGESGIIESSYACSLDEILFIIRKKIIKKTK